MPPANCFSRENGVSLSDFSNLSEREQETGEKVDESIRLLIIDLK